MFQLLVQERRILMDDSDYSDWPRHYDPKLVGQQSLPPSPGVPLPVMLVQMMVMLIQPPKRLRDDWPVG
jgi:hypothetical protein